MSAKKNKKHEKSARRWPRQAISPHDLRGTIRCPDREIVGQVKDLSPIGVGLLIPQSAPAPVPGDRVEVSLSTSLDSAPLCLTALVVQVTPASQRSAARLLVGMSFVEMSGELERQLEAFLIVVEEAAQDLDEDRGGGG